MHAQAVAPPPQRPHAANIAAYLRRPLLIPWEFN